MRMTSQHIYPTHSKMLSPRVAGLAQSAFGLLFVDEHFVTRPALPVSAVWGCERLSKTLIYATAPSLVKRA